MGGDGGHLPDPRLVGMNSHCSLDPGPCYVPGKRRMQHRNVRHFEQGSIGTASISATEAELIS